MIKLFGAAALAAALACAGAAQADNINFGQFGAEYTTLGNVITGTTADGVGITVTGPGEGFEVLQEDSSWAGNFPLGTPVLFDNYEAGPITIDFDSAIHNITDLAIESNEFGDFTATLNAYDGATFVGSQSLTSTSADDPGTQVSFNFSGTFDSIVLSTTNDSEGIGLGGAGGTGGYMPPPGAPEPATWATLMLGVGMIGMMLRRSVGFGSRKVLAA